MNIQAPGDIAQPPVADDKRRLAMDERNDTRPQSGSGGQTAPLRLYLIRHGISRLASHRSAYWPSTPPARRSGDRIVECGRPAGCVAEQNQSGSALKLISLPSSSLISIRWTSVVRPSPRRKKCYAA
ncbi:hypothetical protein SFMTTN_1411 [Sulfuriferula multivorans]|uniref:Uncharacterized protein n=1 Tax=Sulfuriferula multivorans TaxID=1559896 RepID=A0A401JD65_9PROT|nr:hypothetical protein SFMTTN_1411 [Sulfuriferula multivorans]